ncbi:hypothetical protein COCSUDRAFT_33054 [Coccomyxa subellipsoidea C-169]|uniref:Uncharacterized protein n=1 Tax=Coccomyxa subellipsoidea (strain C-169) TaxID=574566 RepID=I0YY90_COCSC|nr:hypothetical protein COCSUDRAFT_33054 [Coccomyxa subellipsoidea C-169]EIE23359.1 hypothetical protein COCSUDRAFT_33054 [Coccomyxa subellipsoidea C-169]|eukprot:XP_005647903.1 hypothetical protein COCSUDRAFT_33054 [Coccomyxa subellipsoidea C-169]
MYLPVHAALAGRAVACSAVKAGQPPLAESTTSANWRSDKTSPPSSGDPSAAVTDRCLRP